MPVKIPVSDARKKLVSQSLFRAVAAKRPDKGLIHHPDRGSQYCAYDYRNRQRRQKRLGYLSPAAYEKQFYEKRIAA